MDRGRFQDLDLAVVQVDLGATHDGLERLGVPSVVVLGRHLVVDQALHHGVEIGAVARVTGRDVDDTAVVVEL